MANPNLASASSVYVGNAQLSLTATTATQLVSNAASSGKAYLVDSIRVSNTDTANSVSVTVSLFQSATNTGTAFEFVSALPIPPGQSLVVVAKDEGVTLLENESIYVTAGTASKLKVNAFWKELS
ncbi:hypothetical protein EB061_12230 [bacterium]|nr:hypothetical protein [bacterium]